MKGNWLEYDRYKANGGVYPIENPDYPRESESKMKCPTCGKIGSLAGENPRQYLDACPSFKRPNE